MGRAGRRFLQGIVLVAMTGAFLALGVVGQLDPRNNSEEYYDAVNDAQCLDHHVEDGFIPFGFRFVESYSQLPVGETVPITVQVSQITNFRLNGIDAPHEINDVTVTVNKEEAPNVEVVTGNLSEPIAEEWEGMTRTHTDDPFSTEVYIGSGAYEGEFRAQIESLEPPLHDAGVTGELVATVDGESHASSTGELVVPMDEEFFGSRGQKNYTFTVDWNSPNPLLPVEATISVGLWVNFTQVATEFTFVSPEPSLFTRSPPDRAEIEIPVRILSEEPALLDFRIRANTYHEHDAADNARLDDGIYFRFLTMQVEGGDELIVARQQEAPTPVGDVVNVYNLITRLLGFIGLFLVVVAMFTGGVFGKKTRRWMNNALGGARRRVLWHSAMGFLIVLVATVHFSFALIETRQDIARGLLWGGLAWALLISLGFTGYYQVRMIKKWNYRVWKHVHLWSAVAVLFFVLVHAILEGSDWKPVLDLLPDQVERLIWPRA